LRVLIVATNQESRPDPVVPLGAACVAGAARTAGHDVAVYDACFAGEAWSDELADRLRAFDPDVVGLSLRNVDDVAWPAAHSYVDHHVAVARLVRCVAPRAWLVAGGSAFTLFPEAFLDALEADAGVVGGGETVFVELLARLPAAGRREGRRAGPRIVRDPRGVAGASETDPAIDLFDLDRYARLGGALNVQTRRGCGFTCSYCTYPQLEGSRVRPYDASRVVSHVERLHRERGATHFFVVDNVFNVPARAALDFCETLAERRLPVSWTAYVTPLGMTADLAAAMARAGCRSVEIGTEAAHPATLAALGKPFQPEDVERACAALRAAGIRYCHSLILGGPGETPETLDRTAELIDRTRPNAVVAMLGVRLYRDTPLSRSLEREGRIRRVDIGLRPVFYLSEATEDRLVDWARARAAARSNWVFPGLDWRLADETRDQLRRRGVKGPLWELLPC